MENKNYTINLLVEAPAQEVFDAINNVSKWWTDDLEGDSRAVNDEFTVHFGDVHVSTQKVVTLIPSKKIEWLVTASQLSFIEQKDEWTNTTISFDIAGSGNKTKINFTHFGLVPAIECYKDCTKGWDYYIKGSLLKLLTEGKGTSGL